MHNFCRVYRNVVKLSVAILAQGARLSDHMSTPLYDPNEEVGYDEFDEPDSCCAMFATAKKHVAAGGDLFANPMHARMMEPMMRGMMNGMMKVTEHNNDCTQKEVADFMNPYSVGKPFEDKSGTFDPSMTGRIKDTMMGGMMVMHRKAMEKGPDLSLDFTVRTVPVPIYWYISACIPL